MQRTSQTLYAYWNEVRGDRIAPRRFDIEPALLGEVLSETFILESDDGKAPAFRLAGTRVCEQFGREFRGTGFVDLFAGDDQSTIAHNVADLRRQGAVVVMEAEARIAGRGTACFEILLMPLVHTGTSINRMLGSIVAIDPPIWLGSERLPALDLLRIEQIWPEGRPHAVAEKFRNQSALIPELAGARLVRVNRRSFRIVDGGLVEK